MILPYISFKDAERMDNQQVSMYYMDDQYIRMRFRRISFPLSVEVDFVLEGRVIPVPRGIKFETGILTNKQWREIKPEQGTTYVLVPGLSTRITIQGKPMEFEKQC